MIKAQKSLCIIIMFNYHCVYFMLCKAYNYIKLVNKSFSIKITKHRNDRKRKETRGDTDGMIIQFLDPLIFDTKIPRD